MVDARLQRAQRHRERLPRRVQAGDGQPAGEQPAGGSRAGSFAYFGPGTGTNPLPIYLAYLNGSARRRQSRRVYRRNGRPGRTPRSPRAWSTRIRIPISSAARRPARRTPTPMRLAISMATSRSATTRSRPACRPISSSSIRMPTRSSVSDSGAFSTYHALQIELRRRLSHGLSLNGSYQYALEVRLRVPRIPLRTHVDCRPTPASVTRSRRSGTGASPSVATSGSGAT